MSEQKHTGKTWTVGSINHGGRLAILAVDGPVLAELTKYASQADAELMAAAPDLLEACEAMIEWDAAENNAPPYDSDGGADFRRRTELCARAFALARAAIAKAKGERVVSKGVSDAEAKAQAESEG